jgi:peptide/nickel transport system substrate-binding protein
MIFKEKKKMKHRLLIVLTLALLALMVAPALAQDANTLNIAFQQEPDSMSPLYTEMWYGTTLQDLFLAPLWWIDDQTSPVPAIAEEIPSADNGGLNADGTVFTIKIRKDAVWSDGEPITANDFVFTYQMIMDDKNTVNSRSPWQESVKSVEAKDDQTLVITTNESYAPWLARLDMVPIPEHILKPVFDKDGTIDKADWNRNPTVASGPYNFVEWQSGSKITLAANDKYFLGQAKIPNIVIRMVPDDATVVSSLISGDSDIGTFISAGDTPAMKDTGKIDIVLVPSGYNEGWFFNVREGLGHVALQDVNVRKALVMLLNRDKINKDLNLGLNYTGASFWENTPYERPDAKPIPYDPEGAKKLLDDAGWKDSNGDKTRDKDGVELVLRYITNQRQVRKDIQATVKQDFAEVGVGITIGNFDSDQLFAGFADNGPMAVGEYDIAEYSDNPQFPDPDTSEFLCSQVVSADNPTGANNTGYCDPEVDKLFAQETSTTDTAKRIEIFHQIDQKFSDAVVWTNVWYDPDLWAANKRLQNLKASGADPLWNAVNWELSS